MTRIDQIKAKRAGVGLRAYDPERAFPGYTLFTPLTADRTAYLIALDGTVVHSWRLPYPPGEYGYLTPEGSLFYNAKILDGSERFISTQPWKGGAALEVDWTGRVLYEVRHPDHHHDGRRLRNGHVILLCLAPLPRDLAREVRGGISGSEHHGEMYGDYLVEMTTAGHVVWEWRSWEHLDPATDIITYAGERRAEWTHANSVAELEDGNLLVSFRNISTVAIIERKTGDIVWTLGPPILAQQHAPVELATGNLLIFDNGTHRSDRALPFSRVIEVDRATKQMVWTYQDPRPFDFFSPLISNAQRLPNGNTLICEGCCGRIFEVAPDGEVVWEFVNPHFGPPPVRPYDPALNWVFRAFRYGLEAMAWR